MDDVLVYGEYGDSSYDRFYTCIYMYDLPLDFLWMCNLNNELFN